MPVEPIPGLAPNVGHMPLEAIKAARGEPPWSVRLIETERMWANLHCQAPGQGNREHYHETDEWWVVLEGELEWSLGGQDYFRARQGDIVFAAKNVSHHIRVVGDKPALRLAVGMPGHSHIYEGPNIPSR